MKKLFPIILLAFTSCEYTGTETLTIVVHYPDHPDTITFSEPGFGTTLEMCTHDGMNEVLTQGPNPETIFRTTAPVEQLDHTYKHY